MYTQCITHYIDNLKEIVKKEILSNVSVIIGRYGKFDKSIKSSNQDIFFVNNLSSNGVYQIIKKKL